MGKLKFPKLATGVTISPRAYVGEVGEGTWDVDSKTLAIHDGETLGGIIIGPAGEAVTPKQFGAVGQPLLADDTLAFQRMADFVNALQYGARIALGRSAYRITGNVTFTNSVTFDGDNTSISKIQCYNNCRIICDGGMRTEYTSASFTFERMTIETDGQHTSSPLRIQYDDGGTTLRHSITMRDCAVTGRNAASGFVTGIELHNVGFPLFDEVRLLGDRSGANTSQFGIHATGDGGSFTFRKLRCYFVDTHVWINGNIEGIIFDDGELIAGQVGLRIEAPEGSFQPFLSVAKMHINVEECCVRLRGITEFNLGSGCDWYGQGWKGIATTWTAVDIDPGTAAYTMNGTVAGGRIIGDGRFAPAGVGVRVRGSSLVAEIVEINMYFQSLSIGAKLDPYSNGATVGLLSRFTNVTTLVSNEGDNFILYSDGKRIGIGLTNPSSALDVAGTVRAQEGFVLGTGVLFYSGPGSPNGVIAAPIGSIWLRTDVGQVLIKTTALPSTTGWVQLATVA